MTTMRKFATALVLGLVMCLALFTTGAFAQSAFRGFHHNFINVHVSSVAVAEPFGFFGLCGGFEPFFDGFGF